MYCKCCGKEIVDEAVICPNCGVQVREIVKEEKTIPVKNGMAVAGFVCSFFVPLLGWIFGGIGLSRSSKRGGKGKGFSIAALAISTVMFVLNFAIMY